jgi:transformer-2 protein
MIPTDAALNNGVAMNTDDQNWSHGNGRSPVRDRNGGELPRRSSRSRSPGPPREGERGLVRISGFGFEWNIHS